MVFPRILTSFSRSYSSGPGSIFKPPNPSPNHDRHDEDRSSPSSTSTIQPLKRSEETDDITPTNAYTPRDCASSANPEDQKAGKQSQDDGGGWSYGLESDNSDISTLDLGPSITTSAPTPKATTPLETHPEYPFTPLPGPESQDNLFDLVKPPEREPDSTAVSKTEDSDQRASDAPTPEVKEQPKTPARPPKRKSDTVVATFRTLSSSGSSLFAGLRPGVNRARTSFRRGGVLSD